MRMFAKVSALIALVLQQQAYVIGEDINSRGECPDRVYEAAGELRMLADRLEDLIDESEQCTDGNRCEDCEEIATGQPVIVTQVKELALEDCENTFKDDVDCSECGPCLARKMVRAMDAHSLAEEIGNQPHVKAVHDGQEYEIDVVCDCGCRETVPFTRPDCSAECGLYMHPVSVKTYEEVAGLPPRSSDG